MSAISVRAAAPATCRQLCTVPAVAGTAYGLSWAAGLALPVPNLAVTSRGTDVIAGYAGHPATVAIQFAATEGLPALGLAIVAAAIAAAARQAGRRSLVRLAAVSGAFAAAVSLTQCALGLALAGWAVPARAAGPAGALFAALSRLDGVKQIALAVLAVTAVALAGRSGPLPRWLGYAGGALAVAITASGLGYLLLAPALAPLAYVSLPLLLIFVTGAGIALGRSRAAAPASSHPGERTRECPAQG